MSDVLFVSHSWNHGTEAAIASVSRCLGTSSVTVVRPEQLLACRWRHEITPDGGCATTIQPPGRGPLVMDSFSLVVSQVAQLTAPAFERSTPKDRDYALSELDALVTSWLASLSARLLNPCGPHGQVGPGSPRAWLLLGARHGLPIAGSAFASAGALLPPPDEGMRVVPRLAWPGGPRGPAPSELVAADGPRSTVLVLGGAAVGPLSDRFGESCIAATRSAGARAVAWRFARLATGPTLAEVDPLPLLTTAEEVAAFSRLVVALASATPTAEVPS